MSVTQTTYRVLWLQMREAMCAVQEAARGVAPEITPLLLSPHDAYSMLRAVRPSEAALPLPGDRVTPQALLLQNGHILLTYVPIVEDDVIYLLLIKQV